MLSRVPGQMVLIHDTDLTFDGWIEKRMNSAPSLWLHTRESSGPSYFTKGTMQNHIPPGAADAKVIKTECPAGPLKGLLKLSAGLQLQRALCKFAILTRAW